MSKSLFASLQINSPSHNTSLSGKEKRERLLKIEQKLQAITVHKQNQVKDQTEEELTRRVLQVEQRCTEEIKDMEAKVRELREGLTEMKMREGELAKKCDLSRRTRMAEIKSLQKKLVGLLAFESKERKDLEISIISILERKDKELLQELADVKQARIAAFNKFEVGLSEEIPELNFRIESRLQEIEVNLECLHQKIRNEVDTLREKIEKEEAVREKGLKNILQLIGKMTLEIKQELEEQKKTREGSKLKLLGLFENAYGRLRLL